MFHGTKPATIYNLHVRRRVILVCRNTRNAQRSILYVIRQPQKKQRSIDMHSYVFHALAGDESRVKSTTATETPALICICSPTRWHSEFQVGDPVLACQGR